MKDLLLMMKPEVYAQVFSEEIEQKQVQIVDGEESVPFDREELDEVEKYLQTLEGKLTITASEIVAGGDWI
ncbi:hypothetical protein [Streptomyces sp. CoH17]|uniref:hypothetical protein n=1 Tax=Streptomyces sp. CoH17 TaxID=2992806 RepID=UPI002270A682|nr:hypothetical protein [Streptomyces sp. CoH17]